MMFQNEHLFPSLTAQENVELPLLRTREALKRVGLDAREQQRGLDLSGGEQQRALVHSLRFIVADEPTGNLDSMTGRTIVALLRETAHNGGIGLLVATHDNTIVESADRVLQISDGKILE